MFKKIVLFVISGLVIWPVASSVRAASLEENIRALLEQINSIQKELDNLKISNQASLSSIKELKRGENSEEVRLLQEELRKRPDIYPSGLVTGFFGPLTEAAVKKLQESNGLVSSGFFDDKVKNILYGKSKKDDIDDDQSGQATSTPPVIDNGLPTSPNIADTNVMTDPVIKVLTPNGGERVVVPQTYHIKWTWDNEKKIKGNTSIWLTTKDSAGAFRNQLKIAEVVSEIGENSYSWKVPSGYEGESWYVLVSIKGLFYYPSSQGARLPSDYSDNVFSIVRPSDNSNAGGGVSATTTSTTTVETDTKVVSTYDRTTTVDPKLILSNPGTGDVWQVGETYKIKWYWDNQRKLDVPAEIWLSTSEGGGSFFRNQVLINKVTSVVGNNEYSWKVPSGYIGSNFRILVSIGGNFYYPSNGANKQPSTFGSGDFVILNSSGASSSSGSGSSSNSGGPSSSSSFDSTSSSSSSSNPNQADTTDDVDPVLTLISPIGGESLVAGQTYTIKWSWSQAKNKTAPMGIYLRSSYVTVMTIAKVISNIGENSYSWTVPAGYIGSDYKILLNNDYISYYPSVGGAKSLKSESGNITISASSSKADQNLANTLTLLRGLLESISSSLR